MIMEVCDCCNQGIRNPNRISFTGLSFGRPKDSRFASIVTSMALALGARDAALRRYHFCSLECVQEFFDTKTPDAVPVTRETPDED